MVNPNKQIRKAIIDALKLATGLAVYENSIPLDTELPNQYIVLTGQGKRKTATSKHCFDWMCEVTLAIVSVNEKGFNSGLANDDVDQLVLEVMESFTATVRVLNRDFINSTATIIEMPDHTINQTNIRYDIWTVN